MNSTEIKVGDTVRSYDFADGEYGRDLTGERACYVEGRVEAIQENLLGAYQELLIKVERQVFGGEELREVSRSEYARPPVNGTKKITGGVTDGVEKLA